MSATARIESLAAESSAEGLIAPTTPLGGDFPAVLRGGAVLLALQVANVALAYLTQVLLARWLGDVQFGVFTYAWTWANLLAVPAGLGLSAGVQRFMPTYITNADWPRLHTIVRWSSRSVFVSGVVVGAACGLVALALRDAVPDHYRLPLWIAFALVPFLALSTLHMTQGFSLGRPAAGYLPWVIGSNLGLLAGAALLLGSGIALNATAVLLVAFVALVAVVLVQLRTVRSSLGRAHARGEPEVRRWLRVSAPLLVSALLYVLLERADLVLVGTLLGPQQAGLYGAAARTALLASLAATAITTIATPRIAALHASGRHAELQAFSTSVARWTFFPAVAAALVLVAFGGPILSLFGPGFRDAWVVLAVLAAGHVVPASVGLAPHLLNMTGHEGVAAAIMGIAVAVSLALALLLIPRLGATGAALATACAMVVRSVGHAILVQRRLGVSAFVLAMRGAP